MDYEHVPVMLPEALSSLEVKKAGIYIDCTLGGGGYTLAIANAVGPKGKVIAIDMDEYALANAKNNSQRLGLENISLVSGNFKNIKDIAETALGKGEQVDGVVMDLGLSSFQLDDRARGFSFQSDGPLNMAFGKEAGNDTSKIVNQYPLPELTRIFRDYGEEKRAYYLAKAIVLARKQKQIKTVGELVAVIEKAAPRRHSDRIHPATRIFQALRMETNEELTNLETVLPAAVELLKPAGRIVVISFHSGEDRIVKRFFRSREDLEILTKRPLPASAQEAAENPRARSAKLRAAHKKR